MVFANPTGISVETATTLLREKLISEEFFIPQDWGLPKLHARCYDPEVDHECHEFEVTADFPTDGRDVGEFLEGVVKGYGV